MWLCRRAPSARARRSTGGGASPTPHAARCHPRRHAERRGTTESTGVFLATATRKHAGGTRRPGRRLARHRAPRSAIRGDTRMTRNNGSDGGVALPRVPPARGRRSSTGGGGEPDTSRRQIPSAETRGMTRKNGSDCGVSCRRAPRNAIRGDPEERNECFSAATSAPARPAPDPDLRSFRVLRVFPRICFGQRGLPNRSAMCRGIPASTRCQATGETDPVPTLN